ncbi:NAD(P)-dependent oxidoreductase [Lactococcus lactis]|uniref:NAD(P)-dependent oxidoreductase n=1 Tax=Lactococcus lactis TaxID=1358 RepID=UPI0028BE9D6D|nr:NAD(P)-dependent oxidoreductase [Lactococcus lactis]WNN67347.1 NAD(P)-dependent oxidoreductase [Lactococcus lactis]WPK09906.1 NAD(P)-dependent oxidoreductase [Lactococcus lactis]
MNDKTVVLNANIINYDGKIDYSKIASEVKIYNETNEDQIIERIQGFNIVVTKEMKLDKEIILKFPDSVKMICEAGTGYNNINLEAVREKKIILCNVPNYSSKRVAHTAIMLMLNLASSVQKQIRMLEQNNYDNFRKHLMVEHVELNGKTLGVIGYGNIAKEIIKVAEVLGMKILVSSRTLRKDEGEIHFTTTEELFKNSDFISLNCPLNEETRHMVNEKTLTLMKKTAFIINTARGPLINESDLIQAINLGVIAGAGLDVQEVEPLDETSPLYTMENVMLTPHIGWKGLETRQRLVSLIKSNIDAFSIGKPINTIR